MNWDCYKHVFKSFEFSINQLMVMTLVSREVLKGWPDSLPSQIREPLQAGLKKTGDLWGDYFDKKITSEELHTGFDVIMKEAEAIEGGRPLFSSVISMYIARPDTSSREIDFSRILHHQAIVMLFAHLDAFLADSIRAICRRRPEVLKSDKQIDWAEIIACGSWEAVLRRLVEEYVFTFGWPEIKKRVEHLKERIGLEFEVSEGDQQEIRRMELIRDLIVHNGGQVSQEYLNRSGRTDVAVGDRIDELDRLPGDHRASHGLERY